MANLIVDSSIENGKKDSPPTQSASPSSNSPVGKPVNTYKLMMQFILEGCDSKGIAQVFGMRLEDVEKITSSELFRSGLEAVRVQQEFELRAGLSGAAREALDITKDIMRSGKSEGTRLRAAQHVLAMGGFSPEPRSGTSVGVGIGVGQQNNQLNIAFDFGDIVQKSQEIAEKNRRVGNVSGSTLVREGGGGSSPVESLGESEHRISSVGGSGAGSGSEASIPPDLEGFENLGAGSVGGEGVVPEEVEFRVINPRALGGQNPNESSEVESESESESESKSFEELLKEIGELDSDSDSSTSGEKIQSSGSEDSV